MLKIYDILFFGAGAVMLLAVLFGMRPEMWRLEYFIASNLLGVAMGASIYGCGVLLGDDDAIGIRGRCIFTDAGIVKLIKSYFSADRHL